MDKNIDRFRGIRWPAVSFAHIAAACFLLGTCSTANAQPVCDVLWTLNGNTTDASGHGNTGTWSGSASSYTPAATFGGGTQEGASFTASSVVGISDATTNNLSLLPKDAGAAWTINFWADPTSASTALSYLAGFGSPDTANFGTARAAISFDGGSSPGFYFWGSGADVYSQSQYTIGSWNMYTMTFAGAGNINMYINGALTKSAPPNGSLSNAGASIQVGNVTHDWGYYFSGGIADFSVWTGALDQSQVTYLTTNATASSFVNAPPMPSTWQSATWLGDWNVGGNWSNGIVPNSVDAHAVINNISGAAEQPSTNVPITLGVLDIIGSYNTTITSVQGVGLTMQASGGSVAQINVSGGANNLMSLPITFASSGDLTVISGSTLEIGYTVTVNSGLEVTTSGTVEFDGGVNVLSGGTLQQAGAIVGSRPLVKNGAGLLILSGSNSYSNGTIVAAGTLEIMAADALPAGSSLTIGAGGTPLFNSPLAEAPATVSATPQINPVPEPGSLALLAPAVFGLMGYGLRRRKLAVSFRN